jgi:lysophospholipase L1-like esterase
MAFKFLHDAFAARYTRPVLLVFAGSSTTYGANSTTVEGRFPNLLMSAFQAKYPQPGGTAELPTKTRSSNTTTLPLANGIQGLAAGVPGTSSANYLTDQTVAVIAGFGPTMVQHMVGSNDWASSIPLATYKANIRSKIDALDAQSPTPMIHVLVQSFPRQDISGKAIPWSAYGNAMKELADADPTHVFYIDNSGPFAERGVPGDDPYNLLDTDLIHPTNAGQALIASSLFDVYEAPEPVTDTTKLRVAKVSARTSVNTAKLRVAKVSARTSVNTSKLRVASVTASTKTRSTDTSRLRVARIEAYTQKSTPALRVASVTAHSGARTFSMLPVSELVVDSFTGIEIAPKLVDGTTPDSYTFTVLSGNVKLSGTGLTRIFISPAKLDGDVVRIGVYATKDGVDSSQVVYRYSVLPHNSYRLNRAGAWSAVGNPFATVTAIPDSGTAPTISPAYPSTFYPGVAYPSGGGTAPTETPTAYPGDVYPGDSYPADDYTTAYPGLAFPDDSYPAEDTTGLVGAYPSSFYPSDIYPSEETT